MLAIFFASLALASEAATVCTSDTDAVTECEGASVGSAMLQHSSSGADMKRIASHVSGKESGFTTWNDVIQSKRNFFNGCTKIFIDVGAHRGTHVRKLYEPWRYKNASYLRIFDEYFGDSGNRTRASSETGVCAFGFEASPRWKNRLEDIKNNYDSHGWRVHWFAPEAVSTVDGETDFFVNDYGDAEEPKSVWEHNKVDEYGAKVRVPQSDLSGFIQAMQLLAPPGVRVMKMDIESAEYVTLAPFIYKQLLCKKVLNLLTIEWHPNLFKADDPKKADAEALQKKIEEGKLCQDGMSTNISTWDDDSYEDDGMPLDEKTM